METKSSSRQTGDASAASTAADTLTYHSQHSKGTDLVTNHAQEAEDLLKPLQALTGKDAAFDLELAQAHATLALAEQQRIANLISLGAIVIHPVTNDRWTLREDLKHEDEWPEIAAALGIGEPT